MDAKQRKAEYDRARYVRLRAERDAAAPPDPISTLTPEERACIAGLIDGEGSIYVTAVGPHRDKTVYPMVVLAMTHRPVVAWLVERLGAGSVQLHNQTNLRRHPHYRPQYRFNVFGKRAKLLCEVLLPYLRVKHEQARLVTAFPVDARVAPGVKIERSALNEERYRLRDEINALNRS
jgi:aromatic ring-cleaving dioxygenase